MAGYIGSKSSVTLVDGYTEAEADAEFVTKTGDSMTGGLTITTADNTNQLTIVSTDELEDTGASDKFVTILNLKLDGYPFIKKGGFSRETIGEIADLIRKVPNVESFNYNPESIKTL